MAEGMEYKVIEEIRKRRSTRRFIRKIVPEEEINAVIEAATWAPSEHNEQPWKFIVIRGDERKEMVRALKAGIQRNRNNESAEFGKGYQKLIPAAIYTARILEQAPATVFVMNTRGRDYRKERTTAERLVELADIQSVSAAVQNMCLEATARGIGTLWTCNIFFAYEELKEWLDTEGEMVAAVALGYTDKDGKALPRKPWEETVFYRGKEREE